MQFGVAVAALVLALAVAAWAYGVYCYVQMVRHRRPGIPMFSIVWPVEYLTERGLEFRRRALWSYAAFAVLALLLIILGRLVPRYVGPIQRWLRAPRPASDTTTHRPGL